MYFLRTILIVVLVLLFTSCYEPEQNCKNFQEGVFEFEAFVEGKLKKTRFVRSSDIEIEYYDGKADTASIRWINDCEYVLKNINPENRDAKNAMLFKILTTEKNKYTFEYSLVGSDNKQKGTAYKVKE